MPEELHSGTETDTVFEILGEIVKSLVHNITELGLVGDGIAYERLREAVDTGEASYSEAELNLHGKLEITGLEVNVDVVDSGDVTNLGALDVVDQGGLHGEHVADSYLVGDTHVVHVHVLDIRDGGLKIGGGRCKSGYDAELRVG